MVVGKTRLHTLGMECTMSIGLGFGVQGLGFWYVVYDEHARRPASGRMNVDDRVTSCSHYANDDDSCHLHCSRSELHRMIPKFGARCHVVDKVSTSLQRLVTCAIIATSPTRSAPWINFGFMLHRSASAILRRCNYSVGAGFWWCIGDHRTCDESPAPP